VRFIGGYSASVSNSLHSVIYHHSDPIRSYPGTSISVTCRSGFSSINLGHKISFPSKKASGDVLSVLAQAVAKALREREQALLTVHALQNELRQKRRGISSLEESGQQVGLPNAHRAHLLATPVGSKIVLAPSVHLIHKTLLGYPYQGSKHHLAYKAVNSHAHACCAIELTACKIRRSVQVAILTPLHICWAALLV